MPEISTTQLGGTMRLGDRVTIFQPKTESSTIRKLYGGANEAHERHRHRYEVNPAYVARLEKAGLQFIGRDEKGERMIVLELKGMFYFRLFRRQSTYSLKFLCHYPKITHITLPPSIILNSKLVHSSLLLHFLALY
jgi:CTP synthase